MRSAGALALICALVGWATIGAAGEPEPLGEEDAPEPAFDRASTQTSLRARIGADIDAWTIELRELDARRVHAKLEREGAVIERTIALEGETIEERSRELASALALIVDDPELAASTDETEGEPAPDDPSTGDPTGGDETAGESGASDPPVDDTTPPAPRRPPLWISVGPRLGLDRRTNLDPGLEVLAAIELLGGHLHPLFMVGWSRAQEASLLVDVIHLGGGLAAGAAVAKERLWLGGGAAPRAMWVKVHEMTREAQIWAGATEIFGLGHLRVALGRGATPQLQLSLRAGADVSLPPLVFTGSTAHLGRAQVRLALALGVGVRW